MSKKNRKNRKFVVPQVLHIEPFIASKLPAKVGSKVCGSDGNRLLLIEKIEHDRLGNEFKIVLDAGSYKASFKTDLPSLVGAFRHNKLFRELLSLEA